jgi:hypothetical protein
MVKRNGPTVHPKLQQVLTNLGGRSTELIKRGIESSQSMRLIIWRLKSSQALWKTQTSLKVRYVD